MSDTRARMLTAAVDRLQRNGLAAMTFTEILADSGAARGAIYHHFPGGKQQLAREAAQQYGEQVRRHLSALPAGRPHEVLTAFFAAVRPAVQASVSGGGCGVAAVTVDGGSGVGDQAELRQTANEALQGWINVLADKLVESSDLASDADGLATLAIATLQGAHVLCRAAGDIAPFDRAVVAMLKCLKT